jgi:hypothetical protein
MHMKLTIISAYILVCLNSASFAKTDNDRFKIPELNESHVVLSEAALENIEPSKIKVLVWNILKAKRQNWARDFLSISKGMDLLLLQEVYLNNLTFEVLLSVENFRFDFGISFIYSNDGIRQQVLHLAV